MKTLPALAVLMAALVLTGCASMNDDRIKSVDGITTYRSHTVLRSSPHGDKRMNLQEVYRENPEEVTQRRPGDDTAPRKRGPLATCSDRNGTWLGP